MTGRKEERGDGLSIASSEKCVVVGFEEILWAPKYKMTLCGPYVLTILKIYQRLSSRCTKGRFCLYIAASRRKIDLRLLGFFPLGVLVSSTINSKLLFFSLLIGHR